MPFYTEAETERWLATQRRELRMPDGTVRLVSGMQLMWEHFDSLIADSGYSYDELIEFALREVKAQKLSFDQALLVIVAFLDNERRKVWSAYVA